MNRAFSVCVAMAALCAGALAQVQSSPAALSSPDAAYNEALRPVEITHRSIENWSEIETAALAVAVKQAATACAERAAARYSGDDLLALSRLCALGQQWPSVLQAASTLIGQTPLSTAQPPQLSQAFSYQIEAALHLNDADTAIAAARAMLERVPYDALTQLSTDETVHYLQLIRTADALALLRTRQEHLLAHLRATASTSRGPNELTVHELYASGLLFPALLQFTKAPSAAETAARDLDTALPTQLNPDDARPVAQARRQYALLGHVLPPVAATASLFSPTETPRINTSYGSSTVLLLFPDWCAQCVRMGRQFMPALYRLSERDVHLYGLLAQEKPPPASVAEHGETDRKATPRSRSAKNRAAQPRAQDDQASTPHETRTAADLLRGTPTLIVAPQVLETFGAVDFPLLAITDHSGTLRFIQTAPENAFVPGGLVDQVTARIAEQWPVPTTVQ